MTGFGQASNGNDHLQVSVTLRSVNSRYLDLALRLKEEQRSAEAVVRRAIEAQVQRGRVDVNVDLRRHRPAPADVTVQMEVVRALHDAAQELVVQGLVGEGLSVGDLLRIPEAFEIRVGRDELTAEDLDQVVATVEEALHQLLAAREQEGENLAQMLGERIEGLKEVASNLRARTSVVRDQLQENLRKRLDDLLQDQTLDESRLAQEAAILVERNDVAEEIDRLEAHLAHFGEVMARKGAIGKRLDFLSQEILRELNTLGSKARDAETTRFVLDGKVLCEQLREQVQNVE